MEGDFVYFINSVNQESEINDNDKEEKQKKIASESNKEEESKISSTKKYNCNQCDFLTLQDIHVGS